MVDTCFFGEHFLGLKLFHRQCVLKIFCHARSCSKIGLHKIACFLAQQTILSLGLVNKYFLRLQLFNNQCVVKMFCHAKSGSKTALIKIAHLIAQKTNLSLGFWVGKTAVADTCFCCRIMK